MEEEARQHNEVFQHLFNFVSHILMIQVDRVSNTDKERFVYQLDQQAPLSYKLIKIWKCLFVQLYK